MLEQILEILLEELHKANQYLDSAGGPYPGYYRAKREGVKDCISSFIKNMKLTEDQVASGLRNVEEKHRLELVKTLGAFNAGTRTESDDTDN